MLLRPNMREAIKNNAIHALKMYISMRNTWSHTLKQDTFIISQTPGLMSSYIIYAFTTFLHSLMFDNHVMPPRLQRQTYI